MRHRPGHHGRGHRIEAGEHAPDVEGLSHADGATVRMAEVLDDTRHTALLIVGQGDGDAAARGRLVRRLKQDQGELLKCGVVLRQAEVTDPAWDDVLVDPNGGVGESYGARADMLVVVRPDGYVGFVAIPPDAAAVDHYFKDVLDAHP